MKQKHIGALSVLLGAAVMLSACTASAQGTGAARTISAGQADAYREESASAPATADESAPVPTEVDAYRDDTAAPVTTEVGETVTAAESSALFKFSDRDLAGTWDAASAVRITLNGSAIACDADAVTLSGSTATVTAAGTYVISGTLDNGSIIVDAGKDAKVQLVLDGAAIQSADFAAIYVRKADKVFVTLADGTENTLSNGGTFQKRDDNDVDGVIFSKDDLTLNGNGTLIISSPAKHGVVSKDDLAITGGVYRISAASHTLSGKDAVGISGGTFMLESGKDGIHSDNDDDKEKGNLYISGGTFAIKAGDDAVTASGTLQIDGGSLEIVAAEGLEANYVRINNGVIRVQATDDGINTAQKSGARTPTIEINGGEIAVAMGPGDTDGIDSNGNLIITGGVIDVTGNSAFDVDGTITFTGGTVTVNGQQVDTIPRQQFGGRGGFGGGQMPDRGQFPGQRGTRNGEATPGQDSGTTPGQDAGTTPNQDSGSQAPNQRGSRQNGGKQRNFDADTSQFPGGKNGAGHRKSVPSDGVTSATTQNAQKI